MVRRVATQVHKQVARLARTGYIQQEPLWYKAVLENPPLPLPPRSPPIRDPAVPGSEDALPFDLPRAMSSTTAHGKKPSKLHSQPIVFLEDDVRKQFFRDHPYEAFRERSLVEKSVIEDEYKVSGAEWERLSQRTRNPSAEDAIRFAVNLYEHTPGLSLSDAYISACSQFRALRSKQELATQTAVAEAEYYGVKFKPTLIERSFAQEDENLKSLDQKKYAEAQSNETKKRWRMRVDSPKQIKELKYTKGEAYERLWKEGIRPDYSPALASSLSNVQAQETIFDFVR